MGEVYNDEILAAGGVILRRDADARRRVLLVHRPRYDDWSFPKGKLDEGESLEETAVREVEEETGLRCRIVRTLAVTRYTYKGKKGPRPKAVHYFLMEHIGGNLRVHKDEEIDSVEWVELSEARLRLSYDFDRHLLAELVDTGVPADPLPGGNS